ncbi:MAG: ExeA family protein [Janthinobacterium lividum]
MYKPFFHLNSDPFTINPDPRFLFMMPQTLEALASLQYGISSKKGFMVLTGEVGTGKTTLLRHTLNALHRTRIHSSFIFNPRLDTLEFLEFLLNDFGLTPATRTKSGMLIELNRWLIEKFRQKEVCVLVVDEAQNLSGEMLEEIRLLTNLETSSEKLLQIILSGQPELEARLRKPDLRQLRQRVTLWCRTQPMSVEQTQAYIAARLKIAGTTETIFPPESVKLIFAASTGIPRIINLICENCLIFAYVDQSPEVLPSHVSLVLQDLQLSTDEEFHSAAYAAG